MDAIIDGFQKAYEGGDGYALSMTLSPMPSESDPNRLYNFRRSTNIAQAQWELKNRITSNSSPFRLPKEEGDGWVEVYFTYWKAVGEILNAEEAVRNRTKVGHF